jgi:hypothetical protein
LYSLLLVVHLCRLEHTDAAVYEALVITISLLLCDRSTSSLLVDAMESPRVRQQSQADLSFRFRSFWKQLDLNVSEEDVEGVAIGPSERKIGKLVCLR